MQTSCSLMKHVPSLCVFIVWILIYLSVLANSSFQQETESTIKKENSYGIHSDILKKSNAYSSKQHRNRLSRTERQSLLRQFVLGDFDSNEDDDYNDDEDGSEKNSSAENDHHVNSGKFSYQSDKLGKVKTKESNDKEADDVLETKEGEKVYSKKSSLKVRSGKKNPNGDNIEKPEENSQSVHPEDDEYSNYIRSENGNELPIESPKTELLKSEFPYTFQDDFNFKDVLPVSFQNSYEREPQYFLPYGADYGGKFKYGDDDSNEPLKSNGVGTFSRLDSKHKENVQESSNNLATRRFSIYENINRKSLRQINSLGKSKLSWTNFTNHRKKLAVKCDGNCDTTTGNSVASQSDQNVTMEKIQKYVQDYKLNQSKDREDYSSHHKNIVGPYSREGKNNIAKSVFANNSAYYGDSLLKNVLNIPVKLVVDFFRDYVFGSKDPGNMVLKDIWPVPKSGFVKYSNLTRKTSSKQNIIDRKRPKYNQAIQSKTKEAHESLTRKLNVKASKETNAVTRTFSSDKHKNALQRNKSFLELIDVLIDGRMLDRKEYLSDVHKKSFLPRIEDISEGNIQFRKKHKLRGNSNSYFIPFAQNIDANHVWKAKIPEEKASAELNAKRSDIYYSQAQPPLYRYDFPNAATSQLDTWNNDQNKHQSSYENNYDASLQTPGIYYRDNYLAAKKASQDGNQKLNEERNLRQKYDQQYLALQEDTRIPPPYTFHIYGGQTSPYVQWDQNNPRKNVNKHGYKYKGIFGNSDEDLEKSCSDFGKQDYIQSCPRGWVSYKQFCFFLDGETHKWSEIPDLCSRKNSKMAMPKSQHVIGFLVDKLSAKKKYTRPYFVGLRKIDEEWRWVDDTPLSHGLSGEFQNEFHSCAAIQEGSLRKIPCDFKAGYICELKTGIEVSRVLTFGDSLTKGYFNGGKSFHPYGTKLLGLLNMDEHRCFVLDISAKNGEQSDHMLQRFSNYLNTKQKTYDWVLILAGTNDLLMGDSSSEKIADTIVIMHEVAHARGAKSLVITIPEIFCERKDCPDVESRRQEINKRLRMYASKAGSKAFLSDLALKISLHQLSLEDRKEFWEPAGVHLKRKGYDKMAEIIFQDLMESIESPFL